MRSAFALLLALAVSPLWAHHPHPHPHTIVPRERCEPIPPLGNRLPPSYRRVYNRPTYLGGKIAYYIAPSSQEAMSWHEHVHRGSYRNKAGRIEPMYLYPKPWEVLAVGPRPGGPEEEIEDDVIDLAPEADPIPVRDIPPAVDPDIPMQEDAGIQLAPPVDLPAP
ncbi:hypothetical protein [Roseimaritima sediminicola]|uniref:hypothetical protein n=1 Tax=Roseimaritima sediminicola TaxID=2662066 RepID=UPI001298416C|nr:hypothetical protein [Roseimaritima sediminicola]